MKRSLWLRRMAAVTALALAAAACGNGDDTADEPDTETEEPAEPETDEGEETDEGAEGEEGEEGEEPDVAVERPGRDDKLDVGYILPESGPLAFLGAPQIQGVQLAISDINEAGGVNGQDVTIETGDEAGDAAQAQEAAARLINGGVDAIVGAAASGMSQEFIQLTHDNEIVQCSASNTSPAFTDQGNNAFYFRTVPPDEAVAPIIADTVVNDGAQNVVIAARADDYGVALAELVEGGLTDLGATVAAPIEYDPNTSDFSAEVSSITGENPDAVIIVGFGEAATLIRQLIEAGVPGDAIYGGDGLFGPALVDDVNPDDPGFISGMKVIGAAGGQEFNDRLNEQLGDEEGNLIYGGQAYDCVMVIALAAIAADSTDPAVFNDEIENVTRDGTECSDFAECKELLENGEDIDYVGASGPLQLERPDPTVGRYAVGQFQDDGSLEIVDDQDVDLGEL
jgi:ABC-type branched-subunit amino acid transport system substrate-binding protein